MSSRLTMSQIDRARACPGSFALPAITLPPNGDAQRGKAIHHFLENSVKKSPEKALKKVSTDAAWRETCERIDIAPLTVGASKVEAELTVAYNPFADSARVLGYSLGRNYKCDEDDIAGTADLVITRDNGTVLVVDYKTGFHRVQASNCGQLKLLGLAIARERSLDQISIAIVHITEDGEMISDEKLLTADELKRVANNTCEILTAVRNARELVAKGIFPDVRVGEHCTYCPAFRTCPANISLAKGLLNGEQNVAAAIKELTPKEAGIVWERLAQAKRILNEIEEGLKAYIDNDPIPLPDGRREVARIDSVRETIVGRAAISVLYEHLGEAVEKIIKSSVSKSDLENFIKRNSPSAQEARTEFNEIIASLRQQKAIKEIPMVNYQPRLINPKRD